MKYLLQQMLGFFIVILTVMIVVGLSFKSLTRQTLIDSYYQQMFSYARSVITMSNNNNGTIEDNIYDAAEFLRNQKITVTFFDHQKDFLHPETANNISVLGRAIKAEDWEKVKQGESISFTERCEIEGNKKDYAIIAQPVYSNEIDSQFIGAVVIFHPISMIDADINSLTENLLTAFLISSLLAIVFSYIFSQYQVNRINRIKNATSKISEGKLDVQISLIANANLDELDELAVSFNKMAQKLKESDQEIQRQEEQRRRFMADAAHEMRTPLTTINGLLEGIAHNVIPEDQKEKSIELMQKETNRLIRLVNENLDYEKIRTNQIKMRIVEFNAAEVLQQVATQLEKKAKENHNEIIIEATDIVPVHADYDRFIQIIFNITQNAIQFTQNGNIFLAAYREANQTVIRIQDTGIGMTQDEVRNIWERYYKVDPSRKNTKYGESGLGLAIVQQLIALHDGKVEVESEKGRGTTFILTFPDSLGKTN